MLMFKRALLRLLSTNLVAISATLCAADSLYDRDSARNLSVAEQRQFGAQSGALRYDARMIHAAKIAQKRARRQTTWHCWAYVKDALLAANVVATRPTSPWARQAGDELVQRFGFKRLLQNDPRRAPVGAVVVYGGPDAGHVELRTHDGFVSDFFSPTPYPRPVIGIFVKQS
jgi:hypothetical protein